MAGITMMVGGALVNALAFSGSNFIFSSIHSSSAANERKRHDHAVEQLQAAQIAWAQKRTDRIDWINEELRRQGHAVRTFHDVHEAMLEYSRFFGKKNPPPPLGPEPQLSDFYVPSDVQKGREITFIVLGLAATGLVAYKLAK